MSTGAPPSVAQAFSPFTDGFHDTGNQLHDWVMRRAREQLADDAARKARLSTRDEVMRYQQAVRDAFLRSIGGLPTVRGPLSTQQTGELVRDGYTISKLVYQSLPGFHVAANLYRPASLPAPSAGVLMLCGHSRTGKAEPPYQRVCLDLVRAGFVVLIVEAPGHGESRHCLDPLTGQPLVADNTTEHAWLQLLASILGQNIARYFTWNAIRGLDLLCELPEVDATRLGVTGNSGGGNQTRYLMLCDDRPAAAMPGCSLSSLEAYLETGVRAFDGEQNLFGCLSTGLDFDDFLAACAPKPLCVGAAAHDYFCIEGVLQSAARAQRVYDLADASEAFKLCVAEHEAHGYTAPLREAAVAWFCRHFLHGQMPGDGESRDSSVESPDDLRCTSSGQLLKEFPGARSMLDLLRDDWQACRRRAHVAAPVTAAQLHQWLALPPLGAPIHARRTSKTMADGLTAERIFFFSEAGIILTAVIYCPEQRPSRATMLLLPDGTASQDGAQEVIAARIAEGQLVMVPDLRGMGAVRMRSRNHGQGHAFRSTPFRVANDHFLLGTSLLARRTFDLLRHIEYLRSRSDLADMEHIELAASGGPAIYGICAAALSDTIGDCLFHDCIATWDDTFDLANREAELLSEAFLAPEFAGRVDIPDLLRIARRDGSRKVVLHQLRRADGSPSPTHPRSSTKAEHDDAHR